MIINRIDNIVDCLGYEMEESSKLLHGLGINCMDSSEQLYSMISKILDSVDYSYLSKSETMLDLQYLYKVEKLGWPLFGEMNNEFKKIVIKCGDEKLEDYFYAYYSMKKLEEKYEEWKTIDVIKEERLDILREALLNYNNKLYYSVTTLCMCQIMGIITDIYDYCLLHGIISEKTIEKVRSKGQQNSKRDMSEKNKLCTMVETREYGEHMWVYTYNYFKNFIFSSKTDIEMQNQHPMRNKICHGEQVNYGTQKHALKAVLCVDMLMVLCKCIMQ